MRETGTSSNGSNGSTPARCALVTGAARGIGAAIAEQLARDGWRVGVNYSSDADGASAVVARIESAGGEALAVRANVADPEAVDAMFGELEERFGPVLLLVNNAGIREDRLAVGLTGESWRRVLDVNLNGPFNTITRALGPMVRKRFGRIVNISSISGAQPLPGQASYAASKAGLDALTRTVAIEVARRGVTVNAIAPGIVETELIPESAEDWIDSVPAKRFGETGEIAALVSYLASDAAGYMTGSVLRIDGGLTAGIGMVRKRSRDKTAKAD